MTAPFQLHETFTFRWTDTQGEPRSLPYLCYLPPGFDTISELPLLLFLHGAGERGTDLTPVAKHGPPKLIEQGESVPFVVISPQCPQDQWWAMQENVRGLSQLIEQIVADYPIDPRRIYFTGMSMGGYGTWALAATYPDLPAAIVPVCGGANLETASSLKDIPAWAFHGRDDEVVPPVRSQEIIEAIQEIGGDARITIYDNTGHDSWSTTYANQDVYHWLLNQRRLTTPEIFHVDR
ncbi:dienelactone hydrolase family protein [Blastopirellula marina]|uniref:Phospholipase n=1 Tax=Blastopirellula marina TaxID=124 RepID=A0A2S8GJ86_9BACT|nr:PHB depolymerase family esterase [Blastopirellula marina]PQO44515.1 phospholipase [Blastopirellula marina]